MSRRAPLTLEVVALGVLVAVLHYIASDRGLYWSLPWADMVTHFLGGLWIGLFAALVLFTQRWLKLPVVNRKITATVILLSVLSVGLGWELYEIFTGLTDIELGLVDTLSDIVFDIFGGLTSLWYIQTVLTPVTTEK